jgi:hypothetical protein
MDVNNDGFFENEPVQNQLMALIDENQRLRAELKFNTTPLQRTWVGLTDEDIEQEFGFIDELLRDCVQRTEAKLKEKNK